MNDALAVYGTQMPLPFKKNIVIDYGMIGSSPAVAGGMLKVDVNGTFFNSQKIKASSNVPHDFSDFNTDGKELWLLVSYYTLLTFFSAFLGGIFGVVNDYVDIASTADFFVDGMNDVIATYIEDANMNWLKV